MKLNANLISVGLPQVSDVPAKSEIPAVIVMDAVYRISTDTITITFDSILADGYVALVRATPKLSAGVSFVKSQFRVIGQENVQLDNVGLVGAYSNKFGNVSAGDNIYASVQLVLENGQKTTEQKVKLEVVL